MAIEKVADTSSDGGLKTVQDLYNIINGNTTTSSGGGQTTTESAGISQDSMNAMLSSVLSGSQGLAAVSSGQRAAGGYGSSVNTMLTNDLMTRSAQAIAALNTSKTTTQTKAPTIQTTGGLTGSGVSKSLATLTALSKFGGGGNDLLKKLKDTLGISGDTITNASLGAGENASSIGAVNGSDSQSDNYNSASNYTSVPDTGLSDQGVSDIWGTDNTVIDNSNVINTDYSYQAPDYSAEQQTLYDQAPAYDMNDAAFANGGEVKIKKPVMRYADGGAVDSNIVGGTKLSIGNNSSNVMQNASINSPVPATTSNSSSFTSAGNAIVNNSGGSGNSSLGNTPSAGAYGSLGNITGSDIGKGFNVAGAALGVPGLSQMGTAIGVANAANPATAALGVMANIATQGVYGTINKGINDFSVGNIADIAMGIASPTIGLANAIADTVGIATLGQIGVNAFGNVGVNDMVGPDQQASINSDTDSIANGGVGGGFSDNTNPSSVNAVNGSDSMSDNSTSGNGGFGGDSSGYGGGTNNSAGNNNSGDGGNGSGGGGSASAADGGHITGAGTGISDSIDAKLSDGEFVLSADVVKAIGVDKLQALQDKYHVPAAVQRLKQFSR